MAAKFVAEEGALRGLVLSLDEGEEWVIGRDPDSAQLLVEDPSVSRQHAVCRRENGAQFSLENLSETNPILINGEHILAPYLLQHGDLITIGGETFRFYSESEAHLYENNVASDEAAEETPEEQPLDQDLLTDIDFNLDETGRWLLKVIGGPNHGAEFFMQPESSYLIGTDPNRCDIVFHDTSVSRQHARLTIDNQDRVWLEDLNSRNGTLVDGEPLKGRREIGVSVVIHVGTTSFVVLDREGKMQTIISPLMPSIVKMLQKEDPKPEPEPVPVSEASLAPTPPVEPIVPPVAKESPLDQPISTEKKGAALSAFIVVAIFSALFAIIGFGATSLFRSPESITVNRVENPDSVIEKAISGFPAVRKTFNASTGRLFLVGHVLTYTDRNQLLGNLEGLSFIKNIDDSGIVVDESVTREFNPLIARNWKGITIQAQAPGRFVVSGFLDTREQAEHLDEYLSVNFPYPDLLEKGYIVEEEVAGQAENTLRRLGFKDVAVQIKGQELILAGGIPIGKSEEFSKAIQELEKIPGVRGVRNSVSELAAEQNLINITDKYRVTGSSTQGGSNLTVMINGRVWTRGDVMDGMLITSIKPTRILLEKEGVKYYIDYNQ